MVSKASLETLARTMSIAFLCLAVVAVGEAQLTAVAAEPAPKKVAATAAPSSPAPRAASKAVVKPKTKARVLASRRRAPKDLEARGLWLKELLHEAGFRGHHLKQAWAVVMKESCGNPRSYNPEASTGDKSYGLFQINMIGNLGAERRALFGLKSNNELFDPLTNAKAAYYMSNHGRNWYSWDIDENGYNGGVSEKAYKRWLARYPKG